MLGDLIEQLRARHAAIAATLVRGGEVSVEIDAGADAVDESSLFEIGSVTKTITGTLLAVLVHRGVVTLDTTIGDLLGDAGRLSAVTLREIATHTAGLPRLAPTHADHRVDPADPYRNFDRDALLRSLPLVELGPQGDEPEYSNLGFQLLGYLLEVATGTEFDRLVVEDVLLPAGCASPRCGAIDTGDHRIPGYDGATKTPRWTQPLGGAGAVELNVRDFGQWLRANTHPDVSPLRDAIALAQEVHWGDGRNGRGLGWRHYNGGLIHNGGTGGFRTFCGLVPEVAAVGVMTNIGGWDAIDSAAIAFLTGVVRQDGASAPR